MFRMPKCVLATEQRAMNHEAPAPTGGRNNFINNRFIAPDEAMPPLYHAAKEILIFTTSSELAAKRRLRWIENVAAKKNISGAAFLPGHHEASRMSWALVKTAFDQPLGRFVVEVGFYRTKDAGNLMAFTRPKQIQQPAGGGEFVVINEHDEITRGVRQRVVASQGDISSRLN